MSFDMSAAMKRALAAVRAQDPMGATREIQAALNGTAGSERPEQSATTPPRLPRAAKWRRDPHVEDAEIVGGEDASEGGKAETSPANSLFARLKAQMSGCADCGPLGGARSGLPTGAFAGLPGQGLPNGVGVSPGSTAVPEMPEGAQFLSRSHSCAQGTRNYRLYIPSCGAAQVQGLVVMLHGCTQTPEDFARGTGMNAAAEAAGFAVAWPEQTREHNMMACWNWFEAGHQRAAQGEPAILAGLTEALRAEFGLGPKRCFVAGLSAGGAMAAILAETHPALFGAIGVHSGLPAGAAQDMVSAFSAMRGQGSAGRAAAATGPRLIVIHGDSDRTVDISNAQRILGSQGEDAAPVEDASARPYRRRLHKDTEGRVRAESWIVAGGGHAWSGGSSAGTYTDPQGPDASKAMIRFFLQDD
ncbi:poly(hydroxyalkanoate) depolymerase family esterase [Limimaricola variabilis]|uniref:Poly(Hydroxyalkanoate) depolymerase family esterase n=1 Tax=Limimaricola variabilis TaxID=1492771 RepID=A0ABR6HMP3_9RHOB|nr:PHB depolymerase family esterase [Limimaricola variabilis]MBB3711835.1 poly(hydroxyalkanoate) depolymerase family esterase [Limimaricola variabilis]